ncbi:hypothetical protein AVEN_137248-1 [Araneus ventricosus]|uniref:Uncharacterized protein n=1 Tax=Araneus ventricosus TaxID=182803 RepID=A0A4Y2DRH6_ARAVE|nr:hypothetical protein AVEN_137248-1 [Araneus ventricosus]
MVQGRSAISNSFFACHAKSLGIPGSGMFCSILPVVQIWLLLTFIYSPSLKFIFQFNSFHSGDGVKKAVNNWLHHQDTPFYYQGLDSLMYRYDKFLNKEGVYMQK